MWESPKDVANGFEGKIKKKVKKLRFVQHHPPPRPPPFPFPFPILLGLRISRCKDWCDSHKEVWKGDARQCFCLCLCILTFLTLYSKRALLPSTPRHHLKGKHFVLKVMARQALTLYAKQSFMAFSVIPIHTGRRTSTECSGACKGLDERLLAGPSQSRQT